MYKTVKEYIQLPYTVEIKKNSDNTYFASIKELPGCMTEGDSLEEAFVMIEDAKIGWISTAIEENHEIPLPEELNNKQYSGKFGLRIPKELHKSLSVNANKNNVSLNTYVNMLLSEKNGQFEILNKIIDYLRLKIQDTGKDGKQMI